MVGLILAVPSCVVPGSTGSRAGGADDLRRTPYFEGNTLSSSAEQETRPRGKRAGTCRPSPINAEITGTKYFAAECPIFYAYSGSTPFIADLSQHVVL